MVRLGGDLDNFDTPKSGSKMVLESGPIFPPKIGRLGGGDNSDNFDTPKSGSTTL